MKPKMLKLILSLFTTSSIVLFYSCQLKEDGGKKARHLLSEIDSINVHIDKYGNPFDQYNQELTKEFADNNRMPLSTQKIDSFQLLYQDYMNSIDSGIQKLKTIQEFDTTFKVVKANLAYREHSKILWSKMANQYLKMYKTGWQALKPEDQTTFIAFINELKEEQSLSQKLGDELNYTSQEFSKKHGFKYVID